MRAKGIDISHWQGKFIPKGNADFVIIKASEGTVTDNMFLENLPAVFSHPVTGAYHYFRTGINPVAQAELFSQKAAGFDFLVVDYEKTNNQLDDAGEAGLKAFWDTLARMVDIPVLLYTSPYIYRDNLCHYRDFWKSVPLWMAHYNGEDPEKGSPEIFEGEGWRIWQYSGPGNGQGRKYGVQSANVDLNVYNGTLEDMVKWLEKGEEPMKAPWQSKTIIFFILTLLVSIAGLFGYADYSPTPEQAQLMGVIVSIVGVILRVLTDKGISFKP